ncbi:MAG TPA: ATP-binding protein [Acidobacteriaceae bacterium]|nr:ATP-binding protein [Acidobacteriaceae bacterium]
MYTGRIVAAARWLGIAIALAVIVAVFRHFASTSDTTVALIMLLLVLLLAGNWGLRYAVGASIAATVLFNYFFLPPIGTLTIADTRNWIALFAFLGTAMYASHLASRIREESQEADARRRESEMLYRLARQLLQPESVAQIFNYIPSSVANAFNSPAVTLFMDEGERIYLSDSKHVSNTKVAWKPDSVQDATADTDRGRPEMIDNLREAMMLPLFRPPENGFPTAIPLRIGVRPTGALLLDGVSLSRETMEALSGLVSISIERAQALENGARAEAAKETERLRSALLDSVTHELRTPLTSIKASISALLTQQPLHADAQRELLTIIDEESDHLDHLIEQAVEMAQLDDNKVHLQLTPQPVSTLVNESVAQWRATHPARELRIALSSTLPDVLADAEWIEKVLGNLLSNAAKYSPSTQPIFVSADLQGEMVTISVADRGAGIEPFEQAMIFDKFYRGQSYREPANRNRISGTGMGLAIARAIVVAHGGTIGVTSQLGHGSVFTFALPAAH